MTYTENEVLLHIEDVTKEYNGRLVLKKVNGVIRDIKVPGMVKGQVVAVIGPSGCGKTTLFRAMAGLEAPTGGRVVLDGTDRAVRAGEVGVVAQNYPLFDHRTVVSNLMLAARKSYPEKEAHDKVVGYLADFGLSEVAHRYPAKLSGGQRQRVAILQQILSCKHFLLMDEPFSGLDPIAKRKAELLVRQIADLDELNTIVLVTHDIAAAVSVADHIWALGRDHDAQGNPIPGAYIVENYNLLDMTLADEIQSAAFIKQLTERFATL